jgi:hypothetical protein
MMLSKAELGTLKPSRVMHCGKMKRNPRPSFGKELAYLIRKP